MNRAELFLRKHSSTILTCIGSVGVVATAVLAVKATPKAMELIDDEIIKRNRELVDEAIQNEYENCSQITKLNTIDTVKVAWKPYIPAIITGASTIACIFGANYLNRRTQASLMSAYALLDSTYKEYRKKTRELHKDEATEFEHEIIKSKFNDKMKIHEDKELFFDYQSMRWFESTMGEVQNATYTLNQQLCTVGFACLNDFYTLLHIEHVPYGYQLGWTTENIGIVTDHNTELLKFEYESGELDDGLEYKIITIDYPTELEYIC